MSIEDRQAECHGAEIKRTELLVLTVGKRKVTLVVTLCGKQTQ